MPARSLTSVKAPSPDRKSTRLNSSHTVIYTLSLHDALPIWPAVPIEVRGGRRKGVVRFDAEDARALADIGEGAVARSEEHTSELQSHSDLHSFPTRRSSDLASRPHRSPRRPP